MNIYKDIYEQEIIKCSICFNDIEVEPSGWNQGHNAAPVNAGRCCGDCNELVVIPTRMQSIYSNINKSN